MVFHLSYSACTFVERAISLTEINLRGVFENIKLKLYLVTISNKEEHLEWDTKYQGYLIQDSREADSGLLLYFGKHDD